MRSGLAWIALLIACGPPQRGSGDDTGGADDASTGGADGSTSDGVTADAAADSMTVGHDAGPDAMTGVLTGGPCSSGAPGVTAYRVRWSNGGGTAQVVYEVNGLPDHSRDKTGAYGYQIGFTPSFVDPFLGVGGLQLDGSSFIDIELTTAGVTQITSAKLSIFGRSFHTTTSGSFNWQTFDGTGSSPTNLVSNVAPYVWYTADMTTEIEPNDPNVLIRIKAGPSSGVLVVHRVELCMQAS